jgi:phage terminase small subunit
MTSSIARAPRKARPRLSQPVLTEAQRLGLMPLDYLLSVMRDPAIDAARRDRMACAALPYCHARLAEKTKKAVDAEAAAKAGDAFGWDGDLEYTDGRSQ